MAPSTFASAAAGSNQQNAQPRDAGSEWYVYLSLCTPIEGSSPCHAITVTIAIASSPAHDSRRQPLC
jgi:hypothetical protein